jgi:predicted sulfurtransferase
MDEERAPEGMRLGVRKAKRSIKLWVLVTIIGFTMALVAACDIGRMFPDVSAAELKQKIDEKSPVRIIDLRSEEEYKAGRLPGALNVAPNQLHLLNNRLPSDKKVPVVFYCRGYG